MRGPSRGKPCAYSMVRRRKTYVKYVVYLTSRGVVGKRMGLMARQTPGAPQVCGRLTARPGDG